MDALSLWFPTGLPRVREGAWLKKSVRDAAQNALKAMLRASEPVRGLLTGYIAYHGVDTAELILKTNGGSPIKTYFIGNAQSLQG